MAIVNMNSFYRHWHDYYLIEYSDANHFGSFQLHCKTMSSAIKELNELIRRGVDFNATIQYIH